MEEAKLMTSTAAHHIEVVRNYFAGCNSGDLDALLSALAPDVVHSRGRDPKR
jgi:ketosteroid isomerase-like protein